MSQLVPLIAFATRPGRGSGGGDPGQFLASRIFDNGDIHGTSSLSESQGVEFGLAATVSSSPNNGNRSCSTASDLAGLYGVETRALVQAVKRNKERFPADFMFQLDWDEAEQHSRSKTVILKRGSNIKFRPYVFTEQGVAMLSSVL